MFCQEEQLKSHETRFRAVSAELQELRSTPQDRKIKSRDQEEHKQREEYLDFEVRTSHFTFAHFAQFTHFTFLMIFFISETVS